MKTLYFIFSCLIVSFQAVHAQQDNLVSNGQFIKGTEGWTILLNDSKKPIKAHIEQSLDYKDYGLADNFIGTNFVELDELSAIQQFVKTTPGEYYTLSFATAHRPDAGLKQFIVTISGKAVYTKTFKDSPTDGSFKYQNIYFRAAEEKSKIAFYIVSLSGDKEKGVLLTDIYCHKLKLTELDKYTESKY